MFQNVITYGTIQYSETSLTATFS